MENALAACLPAFALAFALTVAQPAAAQPTSPAPPPVSEATPVAVPPGDADGASLLRKRQSAVGARPGGVDRAARRPSCSAALSAQTAHVGPAGRAELALHDRRLLRAVLGLTSLIDLPLSYFAGVREAACLRPVEPDVRQVVRRRMKGLVVGCILGGLLLWIPYRLLRKSPRRWWLWTSVAPFRSRLRHPGRADRYRPAVQHVRPDEGQGARARRSWISRAARASKARGSSRWTRAPTRTPSTPTSPAFRCSSGSCSGTRRSKRWPAPSCCSSWATRWATTCSATSGSRSFFFAADPRHAVCGLSDCRRAHRPLFGPLGFTELADVASLPLAAPGRRAVLRRPPRWAPRTRAGRSMRPTASVSRSPGTITPPPRPS